MICGRCGGSPDIGHPCLPATPTYTVHSNCAICSRALSDGHMCFKPIVNQQSWPINPWPAGTAEIIAALKEIAVELEAIKQVLRSK